MDFSKFNLDELQSFHLSYQRLLQQRLKSLDSPQDNNSEELIKVDIELYNKKIKEVESLIREKSAQQLKYSVEQIEFRFGVRNKSVQVHFITTTEAYKKYGPYVTGTVRVKTEYFPALIEKIRRKSHNDGIIKFEATVSNELTDEVKEKLRTEGFYASEIDHLEYI